MSGLLVWLVGCGTGTTELRSTPREPTVLLAPAAPGGDIVWSNLATLFPDDGPGLPAPLGALVPGTGAEDATAALEAARVPGVAVMRDELGGRVVLRSILRDWTDVAVSLVLDPSGKLLDQVNLTLPADEALAALGNRWGAPEVRFNADGQSQFHWKRDGVAWRATLDLISDDRAVLSYERP